MRRLALLAIKLYQRHLSPYKGFCCAYRAYTGCQSCSTLGYRAIRRYGVLDGVAVLRLRLHKCGVAYDRSHGDRAGVLAGALRAQRGVCDAGCDLPCDGCDLPDIDCPRAGLPKGLCDAASCCDCGSCDCGDWRRDRRQSKRSQKESTVPPRRMRDKPADNSDKWPEQNGPAR